MPAWSASPACAGVTWSPVTSNAPWAARYGHTTVIDAAGAIYVIGGEGAGGAITLYNDVWSSADKGANRTQGGTIGVTPAILKVCVRVCVCVCVCACVCVCVCVCLSPTWYL